jgi:hypothetical protein
MTFFEDRDDAPTERGYRLCTIPSNNGAWMRCLRFATTDSYSAARLLSGPLARTIGESLSDPARRFLERVLAEVEDSFDPLGIPFDVKAVRARVKAGRSTVAGILSELEDKAFLERVEVAPAGRGRPAKAWRPTGRHAEADDVLPPADVVFRTGVPGAEKAKILPATPK